MHSQIITHAPFKRKTVISKCGVKCRVKGIFVKKALKSDCQGVKKILTPLTRHQEVIDAL